MMNNTTQVTFNLLPTFIFMGIGLAITAVICYLLYNAQNAVPPQHRKIEPGMIWLLMIPLFNLVWNFFVFPRVAESYQSAFAERGDPTKGASERSIGLAYAICAACAIIPCLGVFAGLAALVLGILFLVKIYNLKTMLNTQGFPVQPPGPPTM
jgi:hypothetical protein